MSIKTTNTYSVVIPSDKARVWLSELLASSIKFEILDPRELGSKWTNVKFLEPEKPSDKYFEDSLGKIIDNYSIKGPFSFLRDQRISVSTKQMESASKNVELLYSIGSNVVRYFENTHLKSEFENIYTSLEMQSKSVLLGKGLTSDFKNATTALSSQTELPDMEIIDLSKGWSIISFNPKQITEVQDFIQTIRKDSLLSKEEFEKYIDSTKKDILTQLAEHKYNPEKLTQSQLQQLAALIGLIQNGKHSAEALHHIFNLDENSEVCFAYVAVSSDQSDKFTKFLNNQKILYEIVNWNKEIVVWENPGGLSAFQGVAQSIGTIDSKETDPSWAIAFFFSLFFAFCLGDAIYGLILVSFCGYFLYFAKLKQQFKSIFRIFFFSGLATILFGALTNSWAGDLFVNTPLKGLLESFQILNPLDPNAPVIFNIFLKNNGGLSPIVGFMGISILIGIANVYTAYFMKIITSIRSKNYSQLSMDLSWVGFVTSIFLVAVGAAIKTPLLTILLSILGVFTLSLFVANEGKGVPGKIISGLISIYNLIGFFADILSFTRLVAVGLTSSIIANVINLLAILIYTSIPIPIVGFVISGAVLLGGHAFNLVVALFGAYINPLRLHYVEFMPKFFEGRGRSLNPLQSELTHLKIVETIH